MQAICKSEQADICHRVASFLKCWTISGQPIQAWTVDLLPAWYLRLGAPAFAKPIARLFNLSVETSFVLKLWKQACIRPIPKVTVPKQLSDFCPISITPVLTRIMERTVVTQFPYPASLEPSIFSDLSHQFAFRPTGSTTGAIVSILHSVTHNLLSNSYVNVMSRT